MIRVESEDLTELFIDFLNEVLSSSYIDKCVYDRVKITRLENEGKALIEVELEAYEIKKYKKEVKAVTYHEADITRSGAGLYEIIIVLDI